MNKEKIDVYDSILKSLSSDGEFEDPSDYNRMDLKYIESCGYLDITYTATGEIYLINITTEGFKFISEGGFTERAREDQERLEYQRNLDTKTHKRSTWSIIIGIMSVVSAVIISLYINNGKNEKIHAQMLTTKAKLDSLSTLVDHLKNVIATEKPIIKDVKSQNKKDNHQSIHQN